MTDKKKLFLLDAYALIFRAHFAFIKNPRINSKGVNTSAVFGFTNSLMEILEKYQPSHLGIAFDIDAPTFRHEMYDEYKSNRDERPEDITIAIPLIYKLAEAFEIPVLAREGYEADDVIVTLAKKAASEGFEVYMMTPDKDYSQAVDKNVYLYRPGRMGKPSEIWDVDKVKEKFGIERIDQVVDIQGLMGDSVDNIPGIPGIGPKTAEKLIAEYGSIENLLEHKHELKGKQKERVTEYADQALLSKELATLSTDVPIEFSPDKLKQGKPNRKLIEQLFAELEFRALGKRVLGEDFKPKEVEKDKGIQQDLFSDIPQMKTSETEATDEKDIDSVKPEYRLIQGLEEIEDFVKNLRKQKFYAFDTETDNIDQHKAKLVGLSFSWKDSEAFYIHLPTDEKQRHNALKLLAEALEDKNTLKIGQNLKYDITVLRNEGISVKGKVYDTMLAHYLIEPERRHNMDYLAQRYLSYNTIPIETILGKKGKSQKKMSDIEPEKIRDYACEDADITWQLHNKFKPEIKKQNLEKLFTEIENPLVYVLAGMEAEGVKVDRENLAEYSRELATDLKKLESSIYELAGMQFNLNSPKQLGDVLFDKLQLDPKAKKTRKTKQYSTSEDVLTKLAKEHVIAEKVLDYRSIQKLKSTYVDALPELINEKTGRIHTNYQQAVAATGRLSSTNPNLQNIPIRNERGRYIRKAFVPRNKDYTLLAADYSQIELRLCAAMSKDEAMMQAFRDGLDIHSSTAARVFGVELDDVSSDMRRKAKTVNFGIIYGISAFGLSERLRIPRREAKEIIDNYFEQFSGVKKYMDSMIEKAKKQGYVETLLGRRRSLRDINSSNSTQRGYAERNAINSPIQGTAADMIKIAMVSIHDELKKRQLKSRMILQVHDELIFDAAKEEVDELSEMVKDKMENAMKLEVPVVVEVGKGENWLVAH